MDDELFRVAQAAFLDSGDAYKEHPDPFGVAPDTAHGEDQESWSEEAPEACLADEPELDLVAWVAARHPEAELRSLIMSGIEILYFKPQNKSWGAVTHTAKGEIARLPLEPHQAREVARANDLEGLSRTRLEAELTWNLV